MAPSRSMALTLENADVDNGKGKGKVVPVLN
jgi:hypothetical protein